MNYLNTRPTISFVVIYTFALIYPCDRIIILSISNLLIYRITYIVMIQFKSHLDQSFKRADLHSKPIFVTG